MDWEKWLIDDQRWIFLCKEYSYVRFAYITQRWISGYTGSTQTLLHIKLTACLSHNIFQYGNKMWDDECKIPNLCATSMTSTARINSFSFELDSSFKQ